MSTSVHETALIDPAAQLGEGVEIGPFCHIGPNVKIGDGTRLISHVSIPGRVTIGTESVVHPFASLGSPAQDFKDRGGNVSLDILWLGPT